MAAPKEETMKEEKWDEMHQELQKICKEVTEIKDYVKRLEECVRGLKCETGNDAPGSAESEAERAELAAEKAVAAAESFSGKR